MVFVITYVFGPISTFQIVSFIALFYLFLLFLIAIEHYGVYAPIVPLLDWLFFLSNSAIVFGEYSAIKNAGFKSVAADVTWDTDDSGERDISELSDLRQRLFEGISVAWAVFGAIVLLILSVAVLLQAKNMLHFIE